MDALDRKLVDFTNNDKSFVMTSEYLLRLASRAKEIFDSSQPAKKNKILQMLLANRTLDQKRLQFNLLKPFSGLVSETKTRNWLPKLDSNQTLLPPKYWAHFTLAYLCNLSNFCIYFMHEM